MSLPDAAYKILPGGGLHPIEDLEEYIEDFEEYIN